MMWRVMICRLLAPRHCAAVTKSRPRKRKRLAAHDAAVGDPALRHERQNQIEQALAEKCHDRDAEQQRRKSPDDFHQFLNQEIDFAAEVAGDRAERDADKTGDENHREGDQQRNTARHESRG